MGARPTVRRPLAQILLDSVAPSDRPPPRATPVPLDGIRLELLADAAQDHRILPAVAKHVAGRPDCPEPWRAPLRRARDEQVVRHLGALAELAVLGAALDRAGVPWVVAKGPAAAALWPSPDMREYYDLDLYVPRAGFRAAVEALDAAGCTGVDRNWPLMARERRAEYAMRGPLGVHLDLHWDFAVPHGLRRSFRTDPEAMIARRRTVALGGGRDVPTFDPVDSVLVLAFHAAQAGAGRLLWLVDIAGAVAACDGARQEVGPRARAMRIDAPVALVVDRAARVLGGPGGGSMGGTGLRAPSALRGAAAALDRRRGVPDLPGDPHRGGRLYAAARPGAWRTATALVGHAVAQRRIERALRRGLPDAGEKALRLDVPDARAREDYLRFVDSGDG
ncbi:nucleotidyltransferase family protein [Isoptericola sp. NPDC058082]|uniref:nucleotidyltransferase domain-containing protein n=1 Tax=Isoptericola sp. NPDC058082 TaxID=3346331 RepID=UPI0036E2FD4C